MAKSVLIVQLPTSTRRELEVLARRQGRSAAELAGEAIGAYLEAERGQTEPTRRALAEADAGDSADAREAEAPPEDPAEP